MKLLKIFILFILGPYFGLGQTTDVKTSRDNSPAIIARNFSVVYGVVRADAIEEILRIFKREHFNSKHSQEITEQILTEYANSPEKLNNSIELSDSSQDKIGIANEPKIINALEWDLFAGNYYLSTAGHNSPAVMASGNVGIWYGIPSKTLRALAARLSENQRNLDDFEKKLISQAREFRELKTELEFIKDKEGVYFKVQKLLEEGRLEEAEHLMELSYYSGKKTTS